MFSLIDHYRRGKQVPRRTKELALIKITFFVHIKPLTGSLSSVLRKAPFCGGSAGFNFEFLRLSEKGGNLMRRICLLRRLHGQQADVRCVRAFKNPKTYDLTSTKALVNNRGSSTTI